MHKYKNKKKTVENDIIKIGTHVLSSGKQQLLVSLHQKTPPITTSNLPTSYSMQTF